MRTDGRGRAPCEYAFDFTLAFVHGVAVMQLVLFTDPQLAPDHAAYWLLMQFGMILRFLTAYPVNVWLIRRGIKEAM